MIIGYIRGMNECSEQVFFVVNIQGKWHLFFDLKQIVAGLKILGRRYE